MPRFRSVLSCWILNSISLKRLFNAKSRNVDARSSPERESISNENKQRIPKISAGKYVFSFWALLLINRMAKKEPWKKIITNEITCRAVRDRPKTNSIQPENQPASGGVLVNNSAYKLFPSFSDSPKTILFSSFKVKPTGSIKNHRLAATNTAKMPSKR